MPKYRVLLTAVVLLIAAAIDPYENEIIISYPDGSETVFPASLELIYTLLLRV